jgi:putative addiction module component (TIGR02574 family)
VATISKADLLKLGVAERLDLIEELWDSIASDPKAIAEIPLSDDERALLDQRLEAYKANPRAARPWSDVRAELLKRR